MPQGGPLGACAGITRMRDVLGWEPQIGVEDGVCRYVEWLDGRSQAIPQWLRAEAA